MVTYFDIIPLDLKQLVFFNLPYEIAKDYCRSRNFCDNRFWIGYNRENYLIEPEDYLEKYTAFEMAEWINEMLNEFFKKRSAVSVSSLKRFLNAVNTKSLSGGTYTTHNEVYYIHPNYLKGMITKPKSELKVGDLALAFIFNNIGFDENALTKIPTIELKNIYLPFSLDQFKVMYKRLRELIDEDIEFGDLEKDPILHPFIKYLSSLARKRTPYFVPGGIKYVNFDAQFLIDVLLLMIDTEHISNYDMDRQDLGMVLSNIFEPEMKTIYEEEIAPLFEA